MAHVEEELLVGGKLRRRAHPHARGAVAEADSPQALLAVRILLAMRRSAHR
jgi:hypothetical protein